MKKPTLLVSACLLGQPVRYDGRAKPVDSPHWQALRERFELLPACPECLGGLPTPRAPAEIAGGDGGSVLRGEAMVKTEAGEDVSAAFAAGAQIMRQTAQRHGCEHALLKANSPSCGNRRIYDGNFTSTLREGDGVAASLLRQHGIQVWNEEEIASLLQAMETPPR
ncbi:DUF523 domain-containing protein [Chromobacterium phragmitis]|uniref:DUF523 domain-containing protein n=1 Tax=Chromobacterium phragmitis TaxID=2202141 RepID=A0ABV0IU32_9NEIS|nr:DUF523 domain-containing protein [Chromobacterium phragmitis]AXE30392.1 DUF523 domain-containing protein [Chromobacterium phragmitis]